MTHRVTADLVEQQVVGEVEVLVRVVLVNTQPASGPDPDITTLRLLTGNR